MSPTPGGWLEDIGKGFDQWGQQAGKALCQAIPREMRLGMANFSRQYAPLLNNPYMQFLIPGNFIVQAALDVAETCDLGIAVRRTACRAAEACEVTIAMAPIAGAIAVATGVGAATVAPCIGIMVVIAGVLQPICASVCMNRPPSLDDLFHLATTVGNGVSALANGNGKGAMEQFGRIGNSSISMPGTPAEKVAAAVNKIGRDTTPQQRVLNGQRAAAVTSSSGPSARERAMAQMRAKADAKVQAIVNQRAAAIEAAIQQQKANEPIRTQPSSSSSAQKWAAVAAGALLIGALE